MSGPAGGGEGNDSLIRNATSAGGSFAIQRDELHVEVDSGCLGLCAQLSVMLVAGRERLDFFRVPGNLRETSSVAPRRQATISLAPVLRKVLGIQQGPGHCLTQLPR